MAQLSNIGRKTKVIRIPRKYEYLTKTFAAWLSTYPDQAKLWDFEEYLKEQQEDCNYRNGSTTWRREMTKAMKTVLAQLKP